MDCYRVTPGNCSPVQPRRAFLHSAMGPLLPTKSTVLRWRVAPNGPQSDGKNTAAPPRTCTLSRRIVPTLNVTFIQLPEGNTKTEEANQPANSWIQEGISFSECQHQIDEKRQGQFTHSRPWVGNIKRKSQKPLVDGKSLSLKMKYAFPGWLEDHSAGVC